MQAALEPVGGEKWHTTSLSVAWHRETFHVLRVQDVAEFNSDCCSIFCLLRKKMARRIFSPGQDMPCWLCCVGFFWLVGAIKSCFKGQFLNFICT
jgi:hypothetical protein